MPLSVCGEMAGRPIEALALIALGFRSLSMRRRRRPGEDDDPLSSTREPPAAGSALLKGSAGSVRNEIETLARK